MSPVSEASSGIAAITEILRQELLKLRPDGDIGLEGLVGHCLGTLLDRQFRLARAGRQHGRDGATTPGAFDVFFEAKLYSERPPSAEDLRSKLLSAIDAHQPKLDVWIPAATVALGENSVAEVIKTGERFGVTVVVVDWTSHPLPPLAVLLAGTRTATTDWLTTTSSGVDLSAIDEALKSISAHPSFAPLLGELKDSLSPATAGFGGAREKNASWLQARFSNRIAARRAFGQFIAPDDAALPPLPRSSEVKKIVDAVADPSNEIVAITGDEGVGKTWLAALAWRELPEKPILLLCTNNTPALEVAAQDGTRFLARLLLEQTGETYTTEMEERWVRRLTNWSERTERTPRIWLVLDGLNERESRPWVKVIDKIMELVEPLGIRMILTARPRYFTQRVASRLTGYALKAIAIPPFTIDEVVAGLRARSIDPSSVSTDTLEFLRNPRIFSLAVSMLDRLKSNELRPERLLFEYWRRLGEERQDLRHSDQEMRELLVSHARLAREHYRTAGASISPSFRRELWKQHSGLAQRINDPTIDDELSEVESGAFFEPDAETGYRLRAESAPYVFGLLIVDELRAVPAGDVAAKLDSALDPIRGMDLLADGMLAALAIACIDDRCIEAVGVAILSALLGIQNLPDEKIDAVLAYVATRIAVFIGAAEALWSNERRGLGRDDALAWLLKQRRDHPAVEPALNAAIKKWLGLWSRVPERFPGASSGAEKEEENERVEKRRVGILERRSELSREETEFLDRHCTEVEAPSQTRLDDLAIELLAGRPLLPFAEAIVAWQLATNLSSRIYGLSDVERDLNWLLRVNPFDARDTSDELERIIAPFQSASISQTGLRTCVAVLRSTGRADQATKADALAARLVPPEQFFSRRRIDLFCDTEPLDPNGPDPSNIDQAAERIRKIEVSKIRSGMSMTMDDHDLRELTPALARYLPDVIVEKLRALSCDLSNRSGHGARFLAFELTHFSALLTPDDVHVVRDAYTAFLDREDFKKERDQYVGAQYILLMLLPHLSAEDQHAALQKLPDLASEMISLLDHFKPLDADVLARHLVASEKLESSAALRRTLFFASPSKVPLTAESRSVIGRCFSHSDDVIRLLSFEVASSVADEALLTTLAESDWSALHTGSGRSEGFYGSKALARAPAAFNNADTLMRMTPEWQGNVAEKWGEAPTRRFAAIVIEQIRHSLKLLPGELPEVIVQQNLPTADHATQFPYLEANAPPAQAENVFDALRRMAQEPNSDEEWKKEQKRTWAAVESYLKKLKEIGADRLVNTAYIGGLSAIANLAPDQFDEIIRLLNSTGDNLAPSLCNVGGCAAIVLSKTDPSRAAALLQKLSRSHPDITLTIGGAQLPFHRLALWRAENDAAVKALRATALMTAAGDEDLSIEVFCAIYAYKQDVALEVARELIASDHPGLIARGLMIAGFCDVNERSEQLLNEKTYSTGFLGKVAEVAHAHYRNNLWARHWYRKSHEANSADDWWRFTELTIAASDGRFVIWEEEGKPPAAFESFSNFARERMKKSAEKKRAEYKKTFLGLTPPSDSILREWGA